MDFETTTSSSSLIIDTGWWGMEILAFHMNENNEKEGKVCKPYSKQGIGPTAGHGQEHRTLARTQVIWLKLGKKRKKSCLMTGIYFLTALLPYWYNCICRIFLKLFPDVQKSNFMVSFWKLYSFVQVLSHSMTTLINRATIHHTKWVTSSWGTNLNKSSRSEELCQN